MIVYSLYVKIDNTISKSPIGRMQMPQRLYTGEYIHFADKTYQIKAFRYDVANSSQTNCNIVMEEVKEKWGIM